MAELDTSLLRVFVATARAGSISRAAEILGRTQPAVSQQLRRLEDVAGGGALLVRTARGVRLSEAGEALLPYAERMLVLAGEAREAVGGRSRRLDGKCGVGLLEDLAHAALPAALADLAGLHPEAQIEVLVASGAAMREAFLDGRIQLLVGDPAYMTPLQPLWRRRSPLVWAAAGGWSPPPGPLPLVLFSRPCNWRQPLLDVLTAAGMDWRIAFESSSLAAVQAAVRSGLGVSALFAENLQAGMAAPTMLPPAPDAEVALFRREDARGDPLVEALDGLLRRHLTPPSSATPARN